MEDPRDKPGKRTVHLFCIVRVTVDGVEADSDAEAIEKAYEVAQPHDLFYSETAREGGKPRVAAIGFADDIEDALVDHEGDDQHQFTTTYVQSHKDPKAKGGWCPTGPGRDEGPGFPVC